MTFGLDIHAPSHVDLVVRNPAVTIDGLKVVDEEKLTPDFSRILV